MRTPFGLLFGALLAAASAAAACEDTTPGATPGSGSGGEGGCPVASNPLYTLTLSAGDEALPDDTTLRVTWSAGEEPEFVLGQPETHLTLEDGSNLACIVGEGVESGRIVCELWTSGATLVEVEASGYENHSETFTPDEKEGCDAPVPSEVEVVLEPESGPD